MLVARARRPAAAATRADEAEDRMVVSEGRNPCGPVMTCTGLNGGGWNESSSTAPNAWSAIGENLIALSLLQVLRTLVRDAKNERGCR